MSRPVANGRVTLGVIGTGNQGFNDIRGFLGDERVQIVAVCDVNRGSEGYWNGRIGGREPAKQMIEQHYAGQAKSGVFRSCDACADYRDLVAREDLDAVLICTPDHWHALPVIAAAEVGLPGGRKDFAVTGDQKQPTAVPAGFDHDTWLGPAPQAPYAPARCHVNFRWNFDYSGGMITDWGAHHVDCAHWGMGADSTGPVKLENISAAFPPDPIWNTATEFHFGIGRRFLQTDVGTAPFESARRTSISSTASGWRVRRGCRFVSNIAHFGWW